MLDFKEALEELTRDFSESAKDTAKVMFALLLIEEILKGVFVENSEKFDCDG